MSDFSTFVYIDEGKVQCEVCGEFIERGIIPMVVHFNDCAGKGIADSIISRYKELKENNQEVSLENLHEIVNTAIKYKE